MPPKAAASAGDATLDPFLKFLLQVLGQIEVEIKTSEHFALLGLNGPKNAPRTVNTFAKPYGYKLDHGKFVKIEGDNALVATTPGKNKATSITTDGPDDDDDGGEPAKKKAKLTPKTKTTKGKGTTASATATADDVSEIKKESN